MLAIALAASLLAPPAVTRVAAAEGRLVQAGGIVGRMWASAKLSASPRLVIVLHGDLAGPRDDYQYAFAKSAADHLDDAVVIAALRPGYEDAHGARSTGDHGLATGDNYTPEVVRNLRVFITSERTAFHARSATLVGHSGGAALAADLVEDGPAIASRLLLVSCPCDLRAWRRHMFFRQFNPAWLLPVRSLSPVEGARRLPPDLRVRIVVGDGDLVAPPRLSAAFAMAARAAGLHPVFVALPGAGHNLLLDLRVMQQLERLQNSR